MNSVSFKMANPGRNFVKNSLLLQRETWSQKALKRLLMQMTTQCPRRTQSTEHSPSVSLGGKYSKHHAPALECILPRAALGSTD